MHLVDLVTVKDQTHLSGIDQQMLISWG